MYVLGIHAHSPESAAALVKDGELVFAVEEERLARVKKTARFPAAAIGECLAAAGIGISEVSEIVFPWRIDRAVRFATRTVVRHLPWSLSLLWPCSTGLCSVLGGARSLFLRRQLRRCFPTSTLPPLTFVGHHLAHAALAYYLSPFADAKVLTMDCFGDDTSLGYYDARQGRLAPLAQLDAIHSLGIVYSLITRHLGFCPFRDEGQVMALSAYGDARYVAAAADLVHQSPDGLYRLNLAYFSFPKFGLLRPFTRRFHARFGPPRQPGEPLTDQHRALARAVQTLLETQVLGLVRRLRARFGGDHLCLGGGVFLNCLLNERIRQEAGFARVFVAPHPGDGGTPAGAALCRFHGRQGAFRGRPEPPAPFWGRSFSTAELRRFLEGTSLDYRLTPDAPREAARLIAEGKVIGWFDGRMEYGPRALGGRNILADPRRADLRDRLNRRVKHRAPFRPFAPAVLAEEARHWFEAEGLESPYMSFAARAKAVAAEQVPAVVHVDGSSRLQTVSRIGAPRFWALIRAFEELTGVPMVLSTSFNDSPEPIVYGPADALRCFLDTDLDALFLGDLLLRKEATHAHTELGLSLPVQRHSNEARSESALSSASDHV